MKKPDALDLLARLAVILSEIAPAKGEPGQLGPIRRMILRDVAGAIKQALAEVDDKAN